MPITTRCPSCDRKLRVPDNLLGTRVKCPGCQTVFTAEDQGEGSAAQPPAAPAPRERPPERPREPVTDRPSEARRRPALTPPPEEDAGGYEDEPEGGYEGDRPRRRGGRSREMALSAVAGPAISLMVIGGLSILGGVLTLAAGILGGALQMGAMGNPGANPGLNRPGMGPAPMSPAAGVAVNVVEAAVFIICGSLVLFGANQMRKLRSRGWAMTATILAMLPTVCCWCVPGIGFGIWSLIVLNKPEVVRAFG